MLFLRKILGKTFGNLVNLYYLCCREFETILANT